MSYPANRRRESRMTKPSFDTFLSHNSADKPAVEALAKWPATEGFWMPGPTKDSPPNPSPNRQADQPRHPTNRP